MSFFSLSNTNHVKHISWWKKKISNTHLCTFGHNKRFCPRKAVNEIYCCVHYEDRYFLNGILELVVPEQSVILIRYVKKSVGMVSRLSPPAAQNVDGCIIDRLVFSLLQRRRWRLPPNSVLLSACFSVGIRSYIKYIWWWYREINWKGCTSVLMVWSYCTATAVAVASAV